MELREHDNEMSMKRSTRKAIRKALQEVPQEIKGNHTLVVGAEKPTIRRLWSPHNYRLYFAFQKTNLKVGRGLVAINHGAEHMIKGYHGCTIKVRKQTAEVTNTAHEGQYFKILVQKLEDVDVRMAEICDAVDYECISALREFIKEFGGSSDLEIAKRYMNDNALLGDEYLDKIPERLMIEDYPFFKKRYKKKVEIYSVARTRDFMRNRLIEQIAPEISDEIKQLREELERRKRPSMDRIMRAISELAIQNMETAKGLNSIVKILQLQQPKPIEEQQQERADYFG